MTRQSPPFQTTYSDIISGTWSRKWKAYQTNQLKLHQLNHTTDDIRCTCGEGPFEDMTAWSHHATTKEENHGQSEQSEQSEQGAINVRTGLARRRD